MQFLKNHYEKILLSLVLLGMAAAAVWASSIISEARQDFEEIKRGFPKAKPIKPTDLSTNMAMLQKLKNPSTVDFNPPQLIFNPVMWKQFADGRIIKIDTSNPADKLQLVRTTPLNLIVALEKVAVHGTNIGYTFAVTNQIAHRFPVNKESSYMKLNETNKYFALREVKGTPEDPEGFVVELNKDKQKASVGKSKPFELLQGFAADLEYPFENKKFGDVRVGTMLTFGGDRYKVIAITINEVRVQADSNDKQTTIKLKTAQ